jgi:uncharacterized membrane protein YsdA (DUF1294 family)
LIGSVSSPAGLVAFAVGALLSIVTFVAYAADKAAARRGARRVPESTLHALSLLGGWPGALVAMRVLRHKTRKQPFRSVFWATVFVNCLALIAAFGWLASRG